MYQVNALLKRFQINCKSIGFHSQLEELPYKIDGISVCFPLCFYWNTYDSKLRRYIVCSDSFFQQCNHLRGLVITERKSKQVTSPHRERSIWSKVNQVVFSNLGSLSNKDNNDNIIKNATSTALHVLCLKHNFFFHWSWHQLHNSNAKITDVTFNGGLEQLGWDYLFLFELLPTLYFPNWVRLNKPNKFLKSDNSFSERHFNHCHYYGCSLLL